LNTQPNKIKPTNFYNLSSPISTNFKEITTDALLEFAFIFLFIFIFRPYVINNLSVNSVFQVALTSAFIFTFFTLAYHLATYKKINTNNWTYKKDSIHYLKALTFVSVIFMVYAHYALHFIYASEITTVVNNFLVVGFLHVFAVGFLLYFILKCVAYINLEKCSSIQNATNTELQILTFFGKNKGEIIKTQVNNLIYIQATGHYIQFFLRDEKNTVEIKTIRNSINEIINTIKKHDIMFQCHRSYIINLDMVNCIEGNSQKATISLKGIKSKIPIARGKYKYFKKIYAFCENKETFYEKKQLKAV